MLFIVKLNDAAQKIMWTDYFHTCERIRNIMDTTGSNTSPLENLYGENRISLVCSWSLGVLATSLNGTRSRIKLQTIYSRQSWLDMQTII